jgi:toxin ParE1/3/4
VRVVWLAQALARRDAEIARIELEDPRAALRQLDEIERQSKRLARHPDMGRESPSRPGTRVLRIVRTRFVITYRVLPRAELIEIFRLAHVRQRSAG